MRPKQNTLGRLGAIYTWRIIPFSKCLITMVIVSPLTGVVPFTNGRISWLINGGDPNYLHPLGWSSKYEPMYINQHLPFRVSMKNPNKWWFDTLQTEPKLGSSNPSIPWRIPRSALKWWCIFLSAEMLQAWQWCMPLVDQGHSQNFAF